MQLQHSACKPGLPPLPPHPAATWCPQPSSPGSRLNGSLISALSCPSRRPMCSYIVPNAFITWFKAALVPAWAGLLVTPLVLYKLFPPEVKHTPEAPKVCAAAALGWMLCRWTCRADAAHCVCVHVAGAMCPFVPWPAHLLRHSVPSHHHRAAPPKRCSCCPLANLNRRLRSG